ncbi:type IV pilus modification PilV family protein [Fuerstiella marisgermanici]|uniref:Type IV pilus modification protein PilV n=1 Tax=Fuerstiella marisgermanici TaxID=1891926 RepID=A0A1P8WFH9_9PLAN|nr:hypothetical protein [Fuerstiella marisgermanici]APZ92825.1 type IV pilus modification protein PilV [Fuerstiella marisgermanici]
MQANSIPTKAFQGKRLGVTLTEVLMSLMIMAIGVTSVITLFPIATLKSAQATKRTNAAILKYNVEAQLDVQPSLIFDPDGDGNLTEHYRGGQRNYIVDPNGYFSIFEYSNDLGFTNDTTLADSFGHDNGNGPSGFPRFDGGIASSLGINLNPATLTDDQRRALRITAQEITSLGDAWDTQFEFILENGFAGATGSPLIIANGGVAGLRIPQEVVPDAAALQLVPTSATETPGGIIRDPERSRIVLFTADGEYSQSYPLLEIASNLDATWSEAVVNFDYNKDGYIEPRTLPREFRVDTSGNGVPDTVAVGKVLIQTRRPVDFSWFLTVRRAPDGVARGVDVVVRFGGEPRYADEIIYAATAPSFPTDYVLITSTVAEPPLKKGGFVFDMTAAKWHRIREYHETSAGVYRVTLEHPAATFGTSAMVIPGIVDVYPMGSRSL